MKSKAKHVRLKWRDPDDAPEITQEWIERAALFHGKKPVRGGKLGLTRYDTADYLKSRKDIATYLKICMEEADDDPAMISLALNNVARAYGITQLARKVGLTREDLHKAISVKNPRLGIILKVLKAFGLKLIPQNI